MQVNLRIVNTFLTSLKQLNLMMTLTSRRILHMSNRITQNQKLMIFMLSMSVFGLSELVTQIVPEISFGPIDLNVAYFAFIPVTLAALFAPASVALGAVTGSVIFSGLLMGDFGGIGELEGFIQLSIGIYVAGMLISNPLSKKQILIASLVCVGIDKLVGGIVDTLKVVLAIEQFEAVAGLPESIYVLEGIAFLTDWIIAGFFFGALPAMYLVPKLYGKIEPLLGMKPREKRPEVDFSFMSFKKVLVALALFVISGLVAFMDELDYKLGVFEPEFIEQFGLNYLYLMIAVTFVVVVAIVWFIRSSSRNRTYEFE